MGNISPIYYISIKFKEDKEMNFNRLKEQLLKNQDNILDIHKSIKDSIGAKSVDILFYDSEKKLFFGKINRLEIQMKFLDYNSIIGTAFLSKRAHFITDIRTDTRYNLALDNPFKMELDNQIVLPVLDDGGNIKGILRISQVPLSFDKVDFESLSILNEPLGMLFSNQNQSIDDDALVDRVTIFNTINSIKKLFDVLSQNSKNQEVEKLIEYGRDNINNIYTYLNPNLAHISKMKKELLLVQNLKSTEKNINILIADDVKINVNILKAMLSTNKRIDDIKLAYDGIETIELLNNCTDCEDYVHIIFLDHHMPGVLGTDIARQIKSKESKFHKIIIVSITNDIEIMEANRDIYDYHLPKPFTKDNINKIMDMIKNVNNL